MARFRDELHRKSCAWIFMVCRVLKCRVVCYQQCRLWSDVCAHGGPHHPDSWEWEPRQQGHSVPRDGGERWGRCQPEVFCSESSLLMTGCCVAGALPERLWALTATWDSGHSRRVFTRVPWGGVWKERPSQKGARYRRAVRASFNVHFSFVCLHLAFLRL